MKYLRRFLHSQLWYCKLFHGKHHEWTPNNRRLNVYYCKVCHRSLIK